MYETICKYLYFSHYLFFRVKTSFRHFYNYYISTIVHYQSSLSKQVLIFYDFYLLYFIKLKKKQPNKKPNVLLL